MGRYRPSVRFAPPPLPLRTDWPARVVIAATLLFCSGLFSGCFADHSEVPSPGSAPVAACTAGTSRCLSQNAEEICSSAGVAIAQPCVEPWTCANGRCRPTVCKSGHRWCSSSGLVKVCNQDGTARTETNCAATGLQCASGNCLPRVCVPGAAYCVGSTARTCGDTGFSFTEIDCAKFEVPCKAGTCTAIPPTSCPANCPTGQRCALDATVPVCQPTTCTAPGTSATGLRVLSMELVSAPPGCVATPQPWGQFGVWHEVDGAKLNAALADGSLAYWIDLAEANSPTAKLTWALAGSLPGAPCPATDVSCGLWIDPEAVQWFGPGSPCSAGTALTKSQDQPAVWLAGPQPMALKLPVGGTAALPLLRGKLELAALPVQGVPGSASLCGEVPLQAWLAAAGKGALHSTRSDLISWRAQPGKVGSGACGPGPLFGRPCSKAGDCGSAICDPRTLGFAAKLTVGPAGANGVMP